MWTAGFVLLTLTVNAPLLPWVLRITGLSKGMILCPCPSLALSFRVCKVCTGDHRAWTYALQLTCRDGCCSRDRTCSDHQIQLFCW